MPHLINPELTSLDGILLLAQTSFLHSLLENGVRPAKFRSNAFVKGIIGGGNVSMSPTKLPSV
jgi:hypothetical protein